jgi:GntR family transcriptional regulator
MATLPLPKLATGKPAWKIDKNNKMPLYLQLKELVRYYVATGAIGQNGKLPSVMALGRELGINFETVRKAYKELEKEGLITMRRGQGTFAVHSRKMDGPSELIARTKAFIGELLDSGLDLDTARNLVTRAFHEVWTQPLLWFTECNAPQVEELSVVLSEKLGCAVKGVLLEDLLSEVDRVQRLGRLSMVITTGFHIKEVRKMLEHSSVDVDFVVTNMSPETRRRLDSFDKNARFGFVCRDAESIPFYRDLVGSELNLSSEVLCKTIDQLGDFLSWLDVVLCSPPVFPEVKRLAPSGLPVFNIFDRVDPQSLLALKERTLQSTR